MEDGVDDAGSFDFGDDFDVQDVFQSGDSVSVFLLRELLKGHSHAILATLKIKNMPSHQ